MRTRTSRRLILASLVVVIASALALQAPSLRLHIRRVRNRIEILYLASKGEISGLDYREAKSLLVRKSPYDLQLILMSRNAYHAITDPYATPADAAAGSVLFQTNCSGCHGSNGRGGAAAPALVGRTLRYGNSDWALFQTIRNGIRGSTMPPHPWSDQSIWQTVTYLESLSPLAASGTLEGAVAERAMPVTYEELAKTQNPSSDWLTYAGSYSGTRYSELTQITRENVGRLAPRWIFQFPQEAYRIEDSPLEDQGIVFANTPDSVVALAATTGERIWEFDRPLLVSVRGCCGVQSRGLAILGDRLYFGTYDAKLIALSAQTGAKLWEVPVADYRQGYSVSGAPLAYGHFVVTGVGGGDYPMRGFIAAFDAATGKELWRFWTVPGPGQPGNSTWPAHAWQNGGGPTWVTGSYDPETDVLYWGVGNPNPDFDALNREGDDLYTESVVALSGTTGRLLWHFQFIPGDDHDYDAVEMPELIDRPGSPHPQQLVVAERNGFFYALDRTNGQFLFGKPFVHQTWAKGLDPSGRPIPNPQATPSAAGTVVYPGDRGATNWWQPSYDPSLDLVFVPTLEAGGVFFREPGFDETPAQAYNRSPAYVSVVAVNAADGGIVWRYRRAVTEETESNRGGVLATAGGIVFASIGSTFYALDSRTGELLWTFPTGGNIFAAPVSYQVDGQQYIMVASGNCLIAFALPDDASTGEPEKTARSRGRTPQIP
jgi:alcohol dehydrogenase (cytochrome c)